VLTRARLDWLLGIRFARPVTKHDLYLPRAARGQRNPSPQRPKASRPSSSSSGGGASVAAVERAAPEETEGAPLVWRADWADVHEVRFVGRRASSTTPTLPLRSARRNASRVVRLLRRGLGTFSACGVCAQVHRGGEPKSRAPKDAPPASAASLIAGAALPLEWSSLDVLGGAVPPVRARFQPRAPLCSFVVTSNLEHHCSTILRCVNLTPPPPPSPLTHTARACC
jgi:hypothetical protein